MALSLFKMSQKLNKVCSSGKEKDREPYSFLLKNPGSVTQLSQEKRNLVDKKTRQRTGWIVDTEECFSSVLSQNWEQKKVLPFIPSRRYVFRPKRTEWDKICPLGKTAIASRSAAPGLMFFFLYSLNLFLFMHCSLHLYNCSVRLNKRT